RNGNDRNYLGKVTSGKIKVKRRGSGNGGEWKKKYEKCHFQFNSGAVRVHMALKDLEKFEGSKESGSLKIPWRVWGD
ncbi:MAG: hypothetical protein IPP96_10875, partial [Chitinophagaceae bacterium]|nr:hypothetical protein [Chitinophagaceae bacterium]